MSVLNSQQFIRLGELIVGKKVASTNAAVEPQQGRLIKNRIKFTVEQTETSESNKARIDIYNLSQLTRNFLEEKNSVVFLRCGYLGAIQTLFFGDIIRPTTKRSGPDVITTLECGDAEEIIQNAYIEFGLSSGATNRQVLDAAVKLLKVSLFVKNELPLVVYEKGFTYSGRVKELLDDLTKQFRYQWNIQNGELQILKAGNTTSQRAVVVSPQTGLIGFPTKNKDGVEFESLLNPKLRPGRAAQLISKQFFASVRTGNNVVAQSLIDGGATVKISKCEFSGDTYEGDWKVKVQGTIPGILEAENS